MATSTGGEKERRALIVTTIPETAIAFLLPLAKLLRANGWKVDLATAIEQNHPELSELNNVFDHVENVAWSRSLKSALNYYSLKKQLRGIVERGSYDVIHTHTPIASAITRLALGGLDVRPKIIYTAHGFHFLEAQKLEGVKGALSYYVYRFIEQQLFRYTDALVTINSEDERAAKQYFRVQRNQTIVRIDGVGIELPHCQPTKEASPGITIGMIAEFNSNKNHRLLIEALNQLQDKGVLDAYDVVAKLAGQGSTLGRIQEAARKHNLSNRIEFLGQLDYEHIAKLTAECDIGLLVSKREGLPKSLMEFIAAGTCVAGTTTRGIADVVNVPSALCAPCPDALVALLEKLIKDAHLRGTIAAQQFLHAKQHYEIGHIISQYYSLYCELAR